MALLGSGLFMWTMAGILARQSAIIRSWFSADIDIAWWTQRGITQVHVVASVWILLGVIVSVSGLAVG
ncbi:hypothetical protein [Arthrobacter sp. R4-81]